MKLYRTVSKPEFDDYKAHHEFRVGRNTIEGKQFFKTEAGVNELIRESVRQNYQPPYQYIFIVHADADCMKQIKYDEQELDKYEAITVQETDLPAFNKCIKFVEQNDI